MGIHGDGVREEGRHMGSLTSIVQQARDVCNSPCRVKVQEAGFTELKLKAILCKEDAPEQSHSPTRLLRWKLIYHTI